MLKMTGFSNRSPAWQILLGLLGLLGLSFSSISDRLSATYRSPPSPFIKWGADALELVGAARGAKTHSQDVCTREEWAQLFH